MAVRAQNSAGCFIKLNEHLLVVRDTWSGRLSLPGGGGRLDESPAEIARRETKEETGLQVTVDDEIGRSDQGFVLFRCRPKDNVSAFPNRQGDFELALPLDSRYEIEEVLLINPLTVPPADWRFVSQLAQIRELFKKESGSPSLAIRQTPSQQPGVMESYGLACIRYLQQWNHPLVRRFFQFFSFLGDEAFFYLTLPFFWLCLPWREGGRLTLLLILSTLINGILKNVFQWPRPFELDPLLVHDGASGFGFPSGHTQIATVFWGYAVVLADKKRAWALAAPMIIASGLARIYLGVHFPHDVLGGWGFGLAVLGLFLLGEKYRVWNHFLESRWPAWLAWIGLIIVGLFWLPDPQSAALLALALGLLVGLALGRPWRQQAPMGGFYGKIWRWVVGSAGLFLIAKIFHWITPPERTFSAMFLIKVFQYTTLGLWLSAGSFWLVLRRPGSV